MYKFLTPLFFTTLLFFTGCLNDKKDSTAETTTDSAIYTYSVVNGRPAGWDDISHGKDEEANYSLVFPQDKVNRIDITVSANQWKALFDDMTRIYGYSFGKGSEGAIKTTRDGLDMAENSIYIPANVKFNDKTWYCVGFKFKGNSSLSSAWSSGNYKMGIKLDFDKLDDEYPEIKNQSFYGFKKLSLSSNFQDQSLLRDKVVPDIFREAGVPAPQTAFYRVYINFNGTRKYFGVYTVIEDPEGAMLSKQFKTNKGNLYKPDGTGADFANGTFTEAGFDKENNDGDSADWSDIKAVFSALHSNIRTTDPTTWRKNLETVFNADLFIKWLAVNTTVQNWDTYGLMAHNYYLYNDNGVINWIPWDNNFALQDRNAGSIGGGTGNITPGGIKPNVTPGGVFPENITGGGMFPSNTTGGPLFPGNTTGSPMFPDNTSGGGIGGGGTSSILSLYLTSSEVGNSWPLIRYLMDDSVYRAKYNQYVKEVVTGAFTPSKTQDKYTQYAALIKDYVVGENGETADATYVTDSASFVQAIETLKSHVKTRESAVNDYLLNQ